MIRLEEIRSDYERRRSTYGQVRTRYTYKSSNGNKRLYRIEILQVLKDIENLNVVCRCYISKKFSLN